ncbi:hypothetical protein [Burkholderia sp. MBR-1]|uniref:hypothetical protein n=1 Tax=Burkholderia sp. MBR-1 TaxID=2732364 RepID=UPI0015EEE03B|nr:hypothetical protein [Burkholderia sp. MBR-1]QMI49710.1 hypothetical protein MBR110_29985 [Burkholderia sp. MBR-1]
MSGQVDMFNNPIEGALHIAVESSGNQQEVNESRTAPLIDRWTRETQRLYLTNMARRINQLRANGHTHRANADEHNARYVLLKLNGLGGEW